VARTIIIAGLLLSSVWIASAQDVSHPTGVLMGRVVDDEGRPMRRVEVQALASDYRFGKLRMLPRGNTATTNDRGEFRLFWLDPGLYYVMVNPSPAPDPFRIQPGDRPPLSYIPSDPDSTFVTTYFPGTADLRSAEAVQVGAGEVDVHAIQAAALPSRLIRVRVVNPTVENGFYDLIAALSSSTDVVAESPIILPRAVRNNEYEIRTGLLDGEYRLMLWARSAGGTFAGSTVVRLERAQSTAIDLSLTKTFKVQGDVSSNRKLPALTLIGMPDAANTSAVPLAAEVRSNGRFILDNVLPGTYSITIDGLDAGAYLRSVKLQDEEVPAERIQFPPNAESMRLTLNVAHDGGTVRGVVINETRTAQTGATVALLRGDLYKLAITNAQGEFQVRGVAPGNYVVIALSPGSNSVQDAALIKRLESRGIAIKVSAESVIDIGALQSWKP